jgi:hypothetical protein
VVQGERVDGKDVHVLMRCSRSSSDGSRVSPASLLSELWLGRGTLAVGTEAVVHARYEHQRPDVTIPKNQ